MWYWNIYNRNIKNIYNDVYMSVYTFCTLNHLYSETNVIDIDVIGSLTEQLVF